MSFLLDENFPKRLSSRIHSLGYKSTTLHELNLLGIKNGKVAEIAVSNGYIILTCDSDYLNFNKIIKEKIRVVYFKLINRVPELIWELLNNNISFIIDFLKDSGYIIITEESVNSARW